jgi:hypothetical protein
VGRNGLECGAERYELRGMVAEHTQEHWAPMCIEANDTDLEGFNKGACNLDLHWGEFSIGFD